VAYSKKLVGTTMAQ